jgi:hypothetical protein
MKAPLFEMSADARLLRQELEKVEIGKHVTYDVLGKAIGKDVSGSTGALQTARRSLFREKQYVFSPISGVGLHRMNDEEIVANSDRDINHIRRTARRGAQRIAAVQSYEGMTPAKQLQHTTRLSVMTAIASITTTKSIEKIEGSAVAGAKARELPIAETLSAFLK